MAPPAPPKDDTVLIRETEHVETKTVDIETKNQIEAATLTPEEAGAAVESLCELIRFETVSATAVESGAYVQCAAWLTEQLQSLGFLDRVFLLPEAPDHSPVVVGVWKGRDSTLPVLLLNSHYDVVPAVASDWNDDTPPFAAVRQSHRIYGRGTQDMKCVCVQYIAALRKLHALHPEWVPERDIVLTYVPDEEVGGAGMAAFLCSEFYQQTSIALALDEGLASTTEVVSVFYGERLPWWVKVTAHGPTGHGSRFIEHTAVEQLVALANKALEFRQGQRSLLGLDDHSNCAHAVAAKNSKQNKKTLGDVTSLNITTLEAGVKAGDGYAYNCVPPKASCTLDIRISPHTQPSEISDMMNEWCRECSTNSSSNQPTLEWNYLKDGNSAQQHATTSTDRRVNPWYAVLEQNLLNQGIRIDPQVFPAATDSRFLRALGVPALGFSPMRNCPILLHEVNEYIPESVFVEGIQVYVSLLHALGSFQEEKVKTDPSVTARLAN